MKKALLLWQQFVLKVIIVLVLFDTGSITLVETLIFGLWTLFMVSENALPEMFYLIVFKRNTASLMELKVCI